MKKDVLISVSTDPVQDYQSLIDYVKDIQGKVDFLHCDVMDGIFVDRKTISAQMINNINANSSIMLDVHLMCNEPLKSIKEFAKAGANIITVHYEAFSEKDKLNKCIDEIHKSDCLAGLAFNPSTSIKDIKVYLHKLDLVSSDDSVVEFSSFKIPSSVNINLSPNPPTFLKIFKS